MNHCERFPLDPFVRERLMLYKEKNKETSASAVATITANFRIMYAPIKSTIRPTKYYDAKVFRSCASPVEYI